jgi:hypothetical protein
MPGVSSVPRGFLDHSGTRHPQVQQVIDGADKISVKTVYAVTSLTTEQANRNRTTRSPLSRECV